MKRLPLLLLSVLVVVAVIAGAAWFRYTHPLRAATRPATFASTTPATRATTRLAQNEPHPTTQLLDILRADDPKYPTTQRLDDALDMRYAARVVLDDPLYLDNQGYLWITRPDAPADFNFLRASATDTATQLLRDRVCFAWWSPTENGLWLPHLVVKNPAGRGFQLLDYDGRRSLQDSLGFRWDRALVLGGVRGAKDRIIVPTATGVCAFTFDQSPESILQSHQQLIDTKDAHDRAVQLAMDISGVIAYVTNAAGTRGARGVARYAPIPPTPRADGSAPPAPTYRWTVLTGQDGWPDRILHLVPLLDGSVLQIVSAAPDEKEQDKVTFSLNSVAASAAAVDQEKVLQLVGQLSAADQDKRDAAFRTLTTYGPGIAPLLEKVLDLQPLEAQIRIRQLLKNKIEPSLGSMSLVDGRMSVVNRLPDGGVIFYAEAGVAIPRPDDSPTYVSPAWLSVRPGRAVELLPGGVTADLDPNKHRIVAWGLNDYVVIDPVMGPQWFIGNHLEPILHKRHRNFMDFVGIDSTGRWIFHHAAATAVPATTRTTKPSAQASALAAQDSFLILDPRLPDPTPRLPGWLLPPSIGKVGWDKGGWPVIYMDVKPDPVPWALEAEGWRVIDLKKEKVFTELPPQVPATRPATTRATTTPDLGPPLLVLPDGTRFYDGRQSLKVVKPDGALIDWPLPQLAVGAGKPTLLRTREGLLFLFNEPGRVVRIRPTPGDDQPFVVDAVFTRQIPSDADPLRIWLDPADRICIAHGGNRITVLFPIGRVPPAIAEKMRPEDLALDEEDK
ncbi:MAG TPA: hypothetical protein VH475_00720 [Tepidisphaeraceae bacterium]